MSVSCRCAAAVAAGHTATRSRAVAAAAGQTATSSIAAAPVADDTATRRLAAAAAAGQQQLQLSVRAFALTKTISKSALWLDDTGELCNVLTVQCVDVLYLQCTCVHLYTKLYATPSSPSLI